MRQEKHNLAQSTKDVMVSFLEHFYFKILLQRQPVDELAAMAAPPFFVYNADTGHKKNDHDNKGDRCQKRKGQTNTGGNDRYDNHSQQHAPCRQNEKGAKKANNDHGMMAFDKNIHDNGKNSDGTDRIVPCQKLG